VGLGPPVAFAFGGGGGGGEGIGELAELLAQRDVGR